MAEMKKMDFLLVKERHDKPPLVLSIFLWIVFFSSPLSGLLNPGTAFKVNERRFHDNPQGFFTFFVLVTDKNFRDDTTMNDKNTPEIKKLSTDTIPENPIIQKNVNLVIP
jgi:hypothetical protein